MLVRLQIKGSVKAFHYLIRCTVFGLFSLISPSWDPSLNTALYPLPLRCCKSYACCPSLSLSPGTGLSLRSQLLGPFSVHRKQGGAQLCPQQHQACSRRRESSAPRKRTRGASCALHRTGTRRVCSSHHVCAVFSS